MVRYVGLDIHKRMIAACLVDKEGKVLERATIGTTREQLVAFAESQLTKEDLVAFEATTNSWGIFDILRPYVSDIVVSNAMKTKAIAEAKIKTDKVDAEVLAQLLRTNYLPSVWVPDETTRRLRELISRRTGLVHDQVRFKNRIHSILHMRLVHCPETTLFSKRGRKWLESVELDEDVRMAIESDLRLLGAVEEEIDAIEIRLLQTGCTDERLKLLMTLPGVSMMVALTLLAALGDLSRFKNADKAAGYLGLAPRTKQSAGRCYHGRITKQGNSTARAMLTQAAHHVRNHPGPIGNFFRKLWRRKSYNVAVVAAARKLVVCAWHMLKNNEPYRYAVPEPTRHKLGKLRAKTTGLRRKPGPVAGHCPKRRPGVKTKRIPSIHEVFSWEGLPNGKKFGELPPGEQKHLRRQKLVGKIRRFEKPQRVARGIRKVRTSEA